MANWKNPEMAVISCFKGDLYSTKESLTRSEIVEHLNFGKGFPKQLADNVVDSMIDRGLLIQEGDGSFRLQSNFTENAVSSGATLWGALESVKDGNQSFDSPLTKAELQEIAEKHDIPDDAFEEALERCIEYGVVYKIGDGYEIMEA